MPSKVNIGINRKRLKKANLMTSQPTRDQWNYAYKIAEKIKEMAPWKWMYDLDNFGFEHPVTGQQGFVCVMGHEQEHFGIMVYRGKKSFLKVLNSTRDPGADETIILEIEGVSLSFEDRKFLMSEDHQIIKMLGLKFRGPNGWPLFRSNQPAHLAWFMDEDELGFLMVGLERLLEVAPMWKNQGKYQELRAASQDNRYQISIPSEKNGEIIWKQEMQRIIPPPIMENDSPLDEKDLEAAIDLPKVSKKFELSLSIMRNPIQDHPGERPYYCYLFILVEASSGHVSGFELIPPKPNYEAAYKRVTSILIKSLLDNQIIPEEIFVKNNFHAALLKPITDRIGIKVTKKPTLPRSEDAITSLMNFQSRRETKG